MWTSVFSLASLSTRMFAAVSGLKMRSISVLTFSRTARSRSVGLKIFPTAVTGSASSSTTRFGRAGGSLTLRSRCSRSCGRSIVCPGDGTTKRIGTSPA
ncbi:hypothetical protein ACVW0I_001025 [Bradyrhizobium sp. LM6.11]